MKGADTEMSKMVQYNDWLDEECSNMAREGLFALLVGKTLFQVKILKPRTSYIGGSKKSAFS